MRNLMIIAIAATALAACGETQTQRTTTGALGGGAVGAVAGGPVGAVVGAGVGAVAGANREKIDETTDKAAANAKQEIAEATDAKDGDRKSAASDDSMQNKTAMNRPGPTNAEVKSAQEALQDLNLYSGPIDGLYGVKTIRAVNEFQEQKDLARTGTLNERTQRELQLALNTNSNGNSSTGTMEQRSQAPSDATPTQTSAAQTTSTQATNAKTQ